MPMTSPYLDPQAITPSHFRDVAVAVGDLLDSRLDVLLLPGEAVLPLEAAARSLGAPGVRALNLVTSVYGATFGKWLEEGGATVVSLSAPKGKPVDPDEVRRAFEVNPDISLVSFVHVEAISGIRNDAQAICAIAREHGAVVILDAVASSGADPVFIDEWGVDVAVIGPQKALAGPAGISIATVSERAWAAMTKNSRAPRTSILSLLDWRERWIDVNYATIPVLVAPLEVLALEAAVHRVRDEGLSHVEKRHHAAAAASRAGALVLGLLPFASEGDAASVVTTLRSPAGADARDVVREALADGPVALSAGFGDLASDVIRVDHTGQRAQLDVVLNALSALARALGIEETSPEKVASAHDAAKAVWADRFADTTA
jgi:aspartate aminotransferase-like enzyme